MKQRNLLKEHSDKVDEATKIDIESALQKNLKDINSKEDAKAADLKQASEDLMQKSMKLGEAVYKASQEQSQNTESNQESKNEEQPDNKDEKVVDGEFEDVTDEDKDKKD